MKRGGAVIFQVKCPTYLVVSDVKSSQEYKNPSTGRDIFAINSKAALGMLHSGFGPRQLNKLFSILDLPKIDEKTLKCHERIIGPVVELIAKESCYEAAKTERSLTIKNLDTLKKLLQVYLCCEIYTNTAEK
ncbi:hypothetical protein TKK_0000961 [Trichogramma kaykai]